VPATATATGTNAPTPAPCFLLATALVAAAQVGRRRRPVFSPECVADLLYNNGPCIGLPWISPWYLFFSSKDPLLAFINKRGAIIYKSFGISCASFAWLHYTVMPCHPYCYCYSLHNLKIISYIMQWQPACLKCRWWKHSLARLAWWLCARRPFWCHVHTIPQLSKPHSKVTCLSPISGPQRCCRNPRSNSVPNMHREATFLH
jgi:hypothetical protein